jgi:hypothetical protein
VQKSPIKNYLISLNGTQDIGYFRFLVILTVHIHPTFLLATILRVYSLVHKEFKFLANY